MDKSYYSDAHEEIKQLCLLCKVEYNPYNKKATMQLVIERVKKFISSEENTHIISKQLYRNVR